MRAKRRAGENGRVQVPRRMVAAVRRGLDPDPRQRWPSMRALATAAAAAFLLLTGAGASALLVGCKDNMFTGNTVPVPPVHRLPEDVAGSVILIDKDPVVETKDPNHVARANAIMLPRDLRIAMTNALVLAGFKVTGNAAEPHDLVAKLEAGKDAKRKIIWITEDPNQVERIISGMVMDGCFTQEEAEGWVNVVDARRLPIDELVAVEPDYRKWWVTAEGTKGPVDMRPLVVFDTMNAVIDLDDENANRIESVNCCKS